MARNNTQADDKSLHDWFSNWTKKVNEQNPNKGGYDLKDLYGGVDLGKGDSIISPTDMLKIVRLAMPTLLRPNMSDQDVLIKKIINNPSIELTEEGLRKAGFSDNDIDLFMEDDRFLEAVAARESEKYKKEWNEKHEEKGLIKEFAMKPVKDSIYYIKPCFGSTKGDK